MQQAQNSDADNDLQHFGFFFVQLDWKSGIHLLPIRVRQLFEKISFSYW